MEATQILVVEDNENTRFLLEISLERAGYEVWTAADGEKALQLIERYTVPHLVLLDINMPVMDGLEVGRRLKNQLPQLPIIFLTALDQEKIVLEALENYGDDYVVKPYVVEELLVRIQRVLRRVPSFEFRNVAAAHVDARLQVDLEQQQAIVNGQEVSLTPIETQLMEVLIDNQGRVVPTELLLQKVWPSGGADENRLYVTVYRLRRKLRNGSGEWDYIDTRSGMGYVLQGREV